MPPVLHPTEFNLQSGEFLFYSDEELEYLGHLLYLCNRIKFLYHYEQISYRNTSR